MSSSNGETSAYPAVGILACRQVLDPNDHEDDGRTDESTHHRELPKKIFNFKKSGNSTTSSLALIGPLKDQDDGTPYYLIDGVPHDDDDDESLAIESCDGRSDHVDDDDDDDGDNGKGDASRGGIMNYSTIQPSLQSSHEGQTFVENESDDNIYDEDSNHNPELVNCPMSQGSQEYTPNLRNDENSEVGKVRDVDDYVTSEGLFDDSAAFYPQDDCRDKCYDSDNITSGTDRVTDSYVEIKQSHKDRRGYIKNDINFDNNNNDDDDDDDDGDEINGDQIHAVGPSEEPGTEVELTNSINPSDYTLFNKSDHYHHHSNESNKIRTTFYSPLPTEEEEVVSGTTSFGPDMPSTPYCTLGMLLNDEMRGLLVSNDC